jgi:hypothetical protein
MPEHLEDRLLLYSNLGDHFVYGSRITFSFMPDGTNVGGVPSALFSTLNANHPTATWETAIKAAASIWEQAANVNLALVPDGGEAVGAPGDQQDDPRFGDIRIGAVPLPAGTLAVTFLPPPANGGTDAGDILLNSNINWQIGSNYDLETVMAHEFGHALGLGDVPCTAAAGQPVMWGTYGGINTTLASDDIAGIQSIYGAPQFDSYNQNGNRNITYTSAANISSSLGANGQAAIPGLDITTAGQSEWFYVTVPATTTGTMSVTVQSTNLSLLSPKVQVYNSSLCLVGTAGTVASLGATVSVSTNVSAGQGYYIKVLAAGGPGAMGSYGLLVNMGSQYQSPIPPPNTLVAQQPDQGSGALLNAVSIVEPNTVPIPTLAMIGNMSGWAEVLNVSGLSPVIPVQPTGQPTSTVPPSTTTTGQNPFAPSPVITGSLSNPSIGTTPVATTPARHKVRDLKRFRPAVVHRTTHVKDHIKPLSHHHG